MKSHEGSEIYKWEKKQEKIVPKPIRENCEEGQRIYWIQFGNDERYEGTLVRWLHGGQYAEVEMDNGEIIGFEF